VPEVFQGVNRTALQLIIADNNSYQIHSYRRGQLPDAEFLPFSGIEPGVVSHGRSTSSSIFNIEDDSRMSVFPAAVEPGGPVERW
jgi:hypothetical protein